MLILALTLAACGGGSDTTTTSEAPAAGDSGAAAPSGEGSTNAPAPSGDAVRSAKVEIVDFAYRPQTVTIEAGGKVIWQNEGPSEHTATLDDGSFSTGTLAEGKLKSESFKRPGTYTYHCEIHPQMTGTVEVVEG